MKRACVWGAVLLLAACATPGRPLGGGEGGGGDSPFGTSQEREMRIRIEVQNLNFNDARLYAIRDAGTRISLGSVGGKSDAVMELDWPFDSDLRIEINLLAGPTCTTERLHVQAGDILELQIASVFTQSRFCR